MTNWKFFWGSVGLLAATTIGAGIFSLPYVFAEAGWLTGFFYLAVFSSLLATIHYWYWRVLITTGGERHLLGLVKKYFGETAFWAAFFAIAAGLLLVLVAYLILANQFIRLIAFSPSSTAGIFIFWALCSLALILKPRRLAVLEFLGTVFMAIIIFGIFLNSVFSVSASGGWQIDFSRLPIFSFKNLFLPFGAVLFSLAGWTAIEPIFEWRKTEQQINFRASRVFASATFLIALLYLLFVLGIWNSTAAITPDTISGLGSWLGWKLELLGWLGVFALATSYFPISREIKNSLEKDLGWPSGLGLAVVIFLPLALLASGFRNFLDVLGLAGGIFLSLQYVFIISVVKKILEPGRFKKIFLNFLIFVFLLAAVYEIYYFIIR